MGDLTDLIDAHLAAARLDGARPQTLAVRRRVLLLADREMGLATAGPVEVSSWLGREGRCAQTRSSYLGHLRAWYGWALGHGLVDVDPTAGLRRPRVPRRAPHPIPDGDLRAALGAPEPLRSWFTLAAFAGLRACEIAPLRGDDVDREAGRLLVREGKGGRSDWLPLHPRAAAVLAAWPGPGRLWPDATASSVSRRCNDWLHAHGSAATLHGCRHWAATSVLRASGGNLRVAQELLRHSSPTTTAVYTAVVGSELRHALDGVDVPAA